MDNFNQVEGAPGLDSETGDDSNFDRISALLSHYARVVGYWEVCQFWSAEEQPQILPLHCVQGQDDSALEGCQQ